MNLKQKVSTVKYWWHRYSTENTFETKHRSGRPKKTSRAEDEEIIQEIEQNPFSNATLISRRFNVCPNTIASRFKEKGIKCYVSAKQTKLSDEHRLNRIAFCENMLNVDQNYLNRIIYTDEKTFCSDIERKKLVYRPYNSRFQPEYVASQTLSGRISAAYWGAIGRDGPISDLIRINGRFKSADYLNILDQNITPYMQRFDNQLIFMQDNSPIHTAGAVMEYLSTKPFELLISPPLSPDLNPIENVWAYITREWPQMEHRNIIALDELVQLKWNNLKNNPGILNT